jgi:transcriptional regulator with XRE-family HTH domain
MATKPNQALIYKKVPAFLIEIRRKAGLTQRELAKRIDRTQWWVARTETGSRRIDIAEFIEWCKGCGKDAAEMLSELAGKTGRPAVGSRLARVKRTAK